MVKEVAVGKRTKFLPVDSRSLEMHITDDRDDQRHTKLTEDCSIWRESVDIIEKCAA